MAIRDSHRPAVDSYSQKEVDKERRIPVEY